MSDLLTDIELYAANMLIYHFAQTPLICPPSRLKAELMFSRKTLPKLAAEIRSSRKALRVLHAANAEGTCSQCPSMEAWGSVELRPIREAIEGEVT